MSELTPPNTEIKQVSDAFHIWTHFLDSRGLHNHDIKEVMGTPEPSAPKNDMDEIAWTHIEHSTRIDISIDGQEEVIYSKRKRYGDLYLATGRDPEGIYSFTSLSEILESRELPSYAASWLGRYVKTWSRDSFGQPRYPLEFLPLRTLPPFNTLLGMEQIKLLYPDSNGSTGSEDRRGNSELTGIALDERARRMTQLAIAEQPHLESWYKSREII